MSASPRRPRLLDLFCCAGGAAMGYHHAGFEVTGVDIDPQPNYPFAFVRADAVTYLRAHGGDFDAIHASPPCQNWSNRNAYNHKTYPALITPTRDALPPGVPYVIENVEIAASELKDPITLCGAMFDLPMYRHRVFETNWHLAPPAHRAHTRPCARNGYLPTPDRPFMSIHGGRHSRAWQNTAANAMDMPWIKVPAGGDIARGIREVCEAIPPAYTRYIGGALHAALTDSGLAL